MVSGVWVILFYFILCKFVFPPSGICTSNSLESESSLCTYNKIHSVAGICVMAQATCQEEFNGMYRQILPGSIALR